MLTPGSDSTSINSNTVADNHLFQDLAQHVGTIRLCQDVPRPSIEGSSIDSSGGVPISHGTNHSRTPSVALTPSPADSSKVLGTARSIDDRLGMSEVADAIEGIVRGSDSHDLFLRTESPAAGSTYSPRRDSRRRSSSHNSISCHNVTDEELPNDLFHTATFQQALSDAKRLMVEMTEVLSSSNVHQEPDSSMKPLHERASKLSRFHCPSTRKVGFVGDSGAGRCFQSSQFCAKVRAHGRREKQPLELTLGLQRSCSNGESTPITAGSERLNTSLRRAMVELLVPPLSLSTTIIVPMDLPSKWNGSAETRQKPSLSSYSRPTEVTTFLAPTLMSKNRATCKI